VPAIRDNRTTSIIFILSIVDLSLFARGTLVPVGVECTSHDRIAPHPYLLALLH
jgi:hypothetical protein